MLKQMSDPTSSRNHAIAWLAMYVWWDGSSDTKARLTMTAHEEHGFPDPTFESIFCGFSFDPSLKADTTPTFLCKFLLGVFRDRNRWKHEESPASFGTVWPSSLPICLCLCHRSLTRCLHCCQQQGTWQCGIAAFFRTADHSQEHTRWNQPVTAYVQDLCLRLWCGSSASFSGTKAHSD